MMYAVLIWAHKTRRWKVLGFFDTREEAAEYCKTVSKKDSHYPPTIWYMTECGQA
jgi:hypothetical protein